MLDGDPMLEDPEEEKHEPPFNPANIIAWANAFEKGVPLLDRLLGVVEKRTERNLKLRKKLEGWRPPSKKKKSKSKEAKFVGEILENP